MSYSTAHCREYLSPCVGFAELYKGHFRVGTIYCNCTGTCAL